MSDGDGGAAVSRPTTPMRRTSAEGSDVIATARTGDVGHEPMSGGSAARAAGPRRRRVLDSPATMLALIAVALGILAGGLTAFYEYTRPTTYRSAAVLLIDQTGAIAASQDDGVVNKLSRLRAKYVGIAETLVFDQPVAARAGLPVGVVHAALAPSYDPSTLLVRIQATLPRAADARRLAELAAQELVTYTQQEQSAAGISPQDAVTFTIVSPALSAQRATPDRQRAALVGAFVFVAITILGALGADLLRRRRQRLAAA